MAISTYADLQTAILSHLGRPGDTNIPVTDLIQFAEAEFNRILRTQNQITKTTFNTGGGQQEYPLAAEVNALLEVQNISTDPTYVIQSMRPAEFDTAFPISHSSAPTNYMIVGRNINLGPTPDGPYTIQMRYYAYLPALGNQVVSNWLLAAHPDAYLYQALRHAQAFLGPDDNMMVVYEQRATQALAAVRQQDMRQKIGGAPVRMRSPLVPRDATFPR